MAALREAGRGRARTRRRMAVPEGIPEAELRDGAPAGAGWFVVNAADAQWVDGVFGAYTASTPRGPSRSG